MSEPTPQQKANLARIRDNQRRSRARRKEYLQELETKYRSCEAVGAEASAEIQAAARKVLDENKRLRRLLRQQGLNDADIDGPEHDEYSATPSPAEMLEVMLVTRKPCRPSSISACGDGQVCKTEDEDDMGSRRESCISASATSVAIAPQSQQNLRAIALAPAPAPAPAPASASPAVAAPPQSHIYPAQPQQQQQGHQQPYPQQQVQQPQHHFMPPAQQHMQHQGQPLQHQQLQAQSQQQQQFFMTPPPPPPSSAPAVHHQSTHTSPAAFTQEYPMYAPQAFSYGVPASQLLDWDMSAVETIAQPGTYSTPASYASPSNGYPVSTSFNSPTPMTSAGYNQDNTSSCLAAADVIRTLHGEAGAEVEQALGCRDGSSDCRVNNTMVFDLMDRYGAAQGQNRM